MDADVNTPLACKFGGTSLANAEQIRRVAAIVDSDPRRRFIVVSAPGKRHRSDRKITDLLYYIDDLLQQGESPSEPFALLSTRFREIGQKLGVYRVDEWLDSLEETMAQGVSRDWLASRGEYLSGRIAADFLNARFIDPADCIRFTEEGRLDPISYSLIAKAAEGAERVVIPGFYGSSADGEIKTFSRGGSDVTGAIVARAAGAGAYENWTDVNGLLMADPRIVTNPRPIAEVTYQELRELAYMGATVLHDEAIFPVREAGIPIHIRNTNQPSEPGTHIVRHRKTSPLPIVGIAGRKGFTTIQLEKAMMNSEHGFGRRMLQILEDHGVSYEHAPSSIDTMSVIISNEELGGGLSDIMAQMERQLQPDRLDAFGGLAMIATVGQEMAYRIGIASKLFSSLAAANVNIRMINQGSSEINIITGVRNEDFETSIRAIYHAFVPE